MRRNREGLRWMALVIIWKMDWNKQSQQSPPLKEFPVTPRVKKRKI
jgi:hypothetical protein